ncbi:MAG TPA: sulfurtransferase [Flavobacteriales bacterium]|nr:sulfurtransferase [Flavobacteriales bacterium]
MNSPLVSVSWLAEHIDNPDLIVLDASSATNISGKKPEFENCVIQGARHFDLKNKFSDSDVPFPNTMPSQEQFQQEARNLEINNESIIVVYDNLGLYNSPRVWWMLKSMGHKNIAVLDGGLSAWVHAGLPTSENHATDYAHGNFTAEFTLRAVVAMEEVKANILSKQFTLIDARSKGRFDGTAPEPREGLSSGHVPGSSNVPFQEVLSNGFMKSEEELSAIFDKLKLEVKPLVFSCGSGLTACITLLAAELVLPNQLAIYDGSWTEWASLETNLIEKQ